MMDKWNVGSVMVIGDENTELNSLIMQLMYLAIVFIEVKNNICNSIPAE